jgi:predicted nucleic acid-binding Zn ribbon protein
MATMRREQTEPPSHCAYCGQPIAGDSAAVERFGERFCSERHAEEFTAGVRAARIDAAAARRPGAAVPTARGRTVGIWVAGAAVLALLALLWFVFIRGSSSLGAVVPVGGTLLTVLLLLACPLAMYFMMRGMGGEHGSHGGDDQNDKRPRTSGDTQDRGQRQ